VATDHEDLEFLHCLRRVTGVLELDDNRLLRSLSGLERPIWVGGNLVLDDITALAPLDRLLGALSIHQNEALSSLQGLHNLGFVVG